MSDTHAATATDGQGQPAPEESGGEPKPSLEELLASYQTAEEEPAKTETQQPAVDPAKFQKVVDYVETDAERRNAEAFDRDFGEAVKTVKGEDLEVDERLVHSYVMDRLQKTAGGPQAWAQRNTNPVQFEKVLGGIRQELIDMNKPKPDEDLTNTRSAMRAAVNGTSAQPNENNEEFEAKINAMSSTEFMEWAKTQR